VFASIKGEWSKNIFIDDELYWNYDDFKHYELTSQEYTLPSDSTYREDRNLLKEGKIDEAEQAKIRMEELQRKDRKLRGNNTH
jgi:hypothetical protein